MFSKACEYAIRAVVYIAAETDETRKVGILEICDHIEAPQHFTAKILQTLSRKHIVNSQKGVNGGFFLDKQQKKKSLKDIVEAVDGDQVFVGCGLGLKQCSETKPCPIHNQFKDIRNRLTKMMENTTVETLANRLLNGESVLINKK
ncbi:RrF2 family transcriptional regulator [Polluticoccus soli]|uniref:RrF2 family transcriptional regulator n=1 Tax=Polluticoccus soli TaxID=3034150 RepID=UPI0023E1B9B8|nr:Rrf2 family transcriptional regulator [Flavipsychrobacter sp. JY13-12]